MAKAETKAKDAKKLVPLRPGMFKMPRTINGKPRIYGQRCTTCGEVFSSNRTYCANCHNETLERTMFGTSGEVSTFTIVHQQLRGALVEVPYVIARVRLPEGVGVQTILTDVEPEDVKIGMPVEICLRQLMEDDDGNPVVNFFFRPKGRRRSPAA